MLTWPPFRSSADERGWSWSGKISCLSCLQGRVRPGSVFQRQPSARSFPLKLWRLASWSGPHPAAPAEDAIEWNTVVCSDALFHAHPVSMEAVLAMSLQASQQDWRPPGWSASFRRQAAGPVGAVSMTRSRPWPAEGTWTRWPATNGSPDWQEPMAAMGGRTCCPSATTVPSMTADNQRFRRQPGDID